MFDENTLKRIIKENILYYIDLDLLYENLLNRSASEYSQAQDNCN